MARGRVQIHFEFEEMDSAPPDLPLADDGRPLPFELALLKHFHMCHPPPSGHEASPHVNAQLAGTRIALPSLPRPADSIERIEETLEVDASLPARYFRCRARLDLSNYLEMRFVFRVRTTFMVFASYLISAPKEGLPDAPLNCYHFGTIPCDPMSVEQAVRSAASKEVEDLLHARRGPGRPLLDNVLPLLRTSKRELGRGAFAWEYKPQSGTTIITIHNASLATLLPKEKRRIREELDVLLRRVRLPTGEPPQFEREALIAVLVRLTDICSELLKELEAGAWPPFGSHRAVDHFVLERFSGDPEMMDALADALKGPERRPSDGRDLAIRVVATASGLGRDRLRRIFRA